MNHAQLESSLAGAAPPSASAPSAPADTSPETVVSDQLAAVSRVLSNIEQALANCPTWRAQDRQAALASVATIKRQALILEGALVTGHRQAQDWKRAGDRSLGDYLGRSTRQGPAAGHQADARAKTLSDLPTIAEGFKDGRVTDKHLEVIARTYTKAGDGVADTMRSSKGQQELLTAASSTNGSEFHRTLKQWHAKNDPGELQRDHDGQVAARNLSVISTPAGTKISGLLPNSEGDKLKRALEAHSPRPAAQDDRTYPQRMADALVDLAHHTLQDTRTTPGALVTPHVSLMITEDTWLALREPSPTDTAGDDAAPHQYPAGGVTQVTQALRGVSPVTTDDGDPLAPSKVGQILCDCEITRMVLGSPSTVVDLGRTKRLFEKEQRRAIVARDRRCIWQGCEIPARWCEVHHIDWWQRDGGHTSVDRGVPLCGHHHHTIHAEDLKIERRPGDQLTYVITNLRGEVRSTRAP